MRLTAASTPPRLSTLVLATGVSVMTLNLFLPSLAGMAQDFGVSYATMTLAISGYFAATAVVQLLLAPLSDKIGRRPVLLAGFAMFSLASLICMTATGFELFLVGRILQCAVVTGSALSAAVVRDTAEPDAAARRLGTIGMAMALGPMLAPLIGGTLEAAFGWRSNFALYTLLGLGTLTLIWMDLGETAPARGRTFASQFHGYSELLGAGRFWANALCIAFSSSTFFIFISGAPIIGPEVYGLSPAAVGLAMATTPAGYMLGNFLTSRIAGTVPLARLLVVARSLVVAGLLLAILLASLSAPAWVFFGMMTTVGIGNGLTMAPAYTGAMSVRPDLAGSASGLSGALAVGIGAVATAIAGLAVSALPDPRTLAIVMQASAIAALGAALIARRHEKHAAPSPLESGTDRP